MPRFDPRGSNDHESSNDREVEPRHRFGPHRVLAAGCNVAPDSGVTSSRRISSNKQEGYAPPTDGTTIAEDHRSDMGSLGSAGAIRGQAGSSWSRFREAVQQGSL